jgi:hypothetical protein
MEKLTTILDDSAQPSAKGLLCEHCKEVILKDIDCIAHHIKELTPSNVHEATIA